MTLPAELHFLRPEAFYALIPLVLFIIYIYRRKSTSLRWKSVCDASLLPYILDSSSRKSSVSPLLMILLATALSIVALSGPVWKKLPQPVFREEAALVIALDLSRSMTATDIKPSRLERAKLKVLDIIKARKGGQTALIVYAGSAFTVTPLTDDDNTIANLVPALETELMPAQGTNTTDTIKLSMDLLQQAGINSGDVLLVTDGIDNADSAIASLYQRGHRLSILGVGTRDGSPIPLSGGFQTDASGAIVISKLDPQQVQAAARKGGGTYVNMQADDSDVERLVKLFSAIRTTTVTEETELTADTWQEEGPWLLLLVIPLVALWPRKGWLMCLPLFMLPVSDPAYAVNANTLWQTTNQQAMQAFEAGDTEKAAELFDNQQWKAAAYYRTGNYEKANEALSNPVSSSDLYNKGNALAKLGNYPDAMNAYDEAIRINPNNEDARHNRELIKQAMEKQQQQNQQQDQQQDQQQNQQSQQQQQQQQEPQSSDDRNQQQDAQSENKSEQDQLKDLQEQQAKQDAEKEREQDKQEQNRSPQEAEQEQEAEMEAQQQHEAEHQDDAETVENQQAMEQWLRRIPDDPGGLMRRKFIYQYRQQQNQAESDQPW